MKNALFLLLLVTLLVKQEPKQPYLPGYPNNETEETLTKNAE